MYASKKNIHNLLIVAISLLGVLILYTTLNNIELIALIFLLAIIAFIIC